MIYDTQHNHLLRAGWTWDGEEYIRDFTHAATEGSAEQLGLSPVRTDLSIEKARKDKWILSITVLDTVEGGYNWVEVCRYDNFCTAAKAVLGNT